MPAAPSHDVHMIGSRHAFSLVELSIVLVILGLLVGGILAGQSLIRASELRAIGAEQARYMAATYAFRDKYFAFPGDMRNATSFWGDQAAGTGACADPDIPNGTPGTCNGNGDGLLLASLEGFRYWQHLGLAGLVEGNYTGIADTGGSWDVTPNGNVPVSKYSGGLWTARALTVTTGTNGRYHGNYGNHYQFGADETGAYNDTSILTPQDAWNVDVKHDDGIPWSGRIIGFHATTCTTSTNASTYSGTYRLDDNTTLCRLMWTWDKFTR